MIGPEGGEILPGMKYIPPPGHSIDHMSISLSSGGEEALFAVPSSLVHRRMTKSSPNAENMGRMLSSYIP